MFPRTARDLVINSDRAGNMDLWILSVDGGEMRQLTTHRATDVAARWSPDGKNIAFYSLRSGHRDIWVIPADGGPARQLTSHPAEDSVPSWSPDGQEIAFSDRHDAGARDLFIVPAERRRAATNHVRWWSPGTAVGSSDGLWLLTGGDQGQLARVSGGWRAGTTR